MKSLIIIFNLLLPAIISFAQPSIQWQKTFGGNKYDEPYAINQTTDGGYIVTGSTASTNGDVSGNHGLSDFWVLKLDAFGAIEWKKTFGGDSNEWPYDIQQTSDGGYIIAGYTGSNNEDVTGYHGSLDAWVLKLSSTGEKQWQNAYGGSDWESAYAIQQTTDGGYIFVGTAASTDGDISNIYGGWDFWVVRLDSIGIILWEKTFGGSEQENAFSVKQTTDGGYIVAGETRSYDGDVHENHGNYDFWVIKIYSSGELEWEKTYGGNNGDFANDIHQTIDGGYIVAGITGSHNTGDVSGHDSLGSLDYWVVKLSDNGQLQWQKALGGKEPDRCNSIVQTYDGMYVVLGVTESTDGDILDNDGGADMWAVKLNGQGDIVWQKTLGGTMAESGSDIQQTSDNGYILTGYTWSTDGDLTGSTNHGQNDFWVVKLAPETVGINETPQPPTSQLELFPNPAQQAITLKTGSEASELSVVLTDVLGRRLLEKNIPNGGSVQLASLPDGVYWVQATDEGGKMYSARLRKKT